MTAPSASASSLNPVHFVEEMYNPARFVRLCIPASVFPPPPSSQPVWRPAEMNARANHVFNTQFENSTIDLVNHIERDATTRAEAVKSFQEMVAVRAATGKPEWGQDACRFDASTGCNRGGFFLWNGFCGRRFALTAGRRAIRKAPQDW
jgi:hypothetical protein